MARTTVFPINGDVKEKVNATRIPTLKFFTNCNVQMYEVSSFNGYSCKSSLKNVDIVRNSNEVRVCSLKDV